jgi:hypothetical protein
VAKNISKSEINEKRLEKSDKTLQLMWEDKCKNLLRFFGIFKKVKETVLVFIQI